MSYTIDQFNPNKSVLIVDSTEISLSFITLKKEVALKELYGSLPKTFEAINKNPSEILKIIWVLIDDKKYFKNSFDNFNNFLNKAKEGTASWANKMTACFYDIVTKSMPVIINAKRQQEINDIKKVQTTDTPCYAVYYDSLSKRYGYSIDDFYNLTIRQLSILLSVIGDESYKEVELQAAIQGRTLKPRVTYNDISIEEEKSQEDQAMDALKELQRKYKESNNAK